MSIVSKNLSGNPFFLSNCFRGHFDLPLQWNISAFHYRKATMEKKIRNYGKSRENTKRGEILVENKKKIKNTDLDHVTKSML